MDRTIILAGNIVALAEMLEADQTQFCAWLQNEELRTLIDDSRVPDLASQMAWFQRVQRQDRKFFSLVALPKQVLIGNCGFVDINPDTKTATLRITIGNSDFHSKGLGSEAIQLMVRYAFEVAGWHHILLKVLSTNARAIRAYEKAGFARVTEDVQDGKTIVTMELAVSED